MRPKNDVSINKIISSTLSAEVFFIYAWKIVIVLSSFGEPKAAFLHKHSLFQKKRQSASKSAESGRRIEMGWVKFGRLRQNAGQKGFLAGIKWICNQSPSNLPPSLQPPLSFFQNLPYSFLPISDSNQHPSPISPTELKKNRIIQEKKKRKKKRMRKQRLRHCTKILPDKIPCAGYGLSLLWKRISKESGCMGIQYDNGGGWEVEGKGEKGRGGTENGGTGWRGVGWGSAERRKMEEEGGEGRGGSWLLIQTRISFLFCPPHCGALPREEAKEE